ncbi:hypothetical protein D3C77_399820 [compost metagenome]
MPIYDAIYRIEVNGEETEEPISINTIESHPEFYKVKNNIYCTYENCLAKLEYVPKGKKKAYFKTWPKQDHTTECSDYFEREKIARSTRNSATSTMALSDKHIADILNDIKRKRQNTDNNKTGGTGKKKREKKNPRVDSDLPEASVVNINPTTGGEADMKEGDSKTRAPSVRRRTLLLLNEDDVGFTRALSDVYINSVEVAPNRVVIKAYNGSKSCDIYFEEFFFTSSPVNFINRFVELSNIVKSNKRLSFSCVGEVLKRDDAISMLVNKHSDFRVEDLYLSIFLVNFKSE